jgi:hypothetical protein
MALSLRRDSPIPMSGAGSVMVSVATMRKGVIGPDSFGGALVLIGSDSFDMLGGFQESKENNPGDDQAKAEDGEEVVEHN